MIEVSFNHLFFMGEQKVVNLHIASSFMSKCNMLHIYMKVYMKCLTLHFH